MANVKIGSRANVTTVVRPFHALMAYNRYFDNWFNRKPLRKRQKKEEKPYKVEIQMLRKNESEEYCDINLYDPDYKKVGIFENIKDDMIVYVAGKLHALGQVVRKIIPLQLITID